MKKKNLKALATFASKFFSCAGNVASMSSKDGIFGPSAESNDSVPLKRLSVVPCFFPSNLADLR